jgi:OOP family OmpA-OmpF porin
VSSANQTPGKPGGDLEKLRELLLGREKQQLKHLDERLSNQESRTADVAEVLPDAFVRASKDPVLEANLETQVVRTIRSFVKNDTSTFAEYLFPVMGPAIRRAVADSLKALVERINATMEHNLTAKGLRWRIEAARTGVPFAQVVLRHTLLYSVHEAFLIKRDSGLVLSHVHREENLRLDEDAVGSMLSAIQSFIQDSLGMSADEPLRSAELGDRTLWIINGPEALLACIISGTPPRTLRDELMAVVEKIHAVYGSRFSESNQQLSRDAGLLGLMQQSLRDELHADSERPKSRAPLYWAIGLGLLAIVLIFGAISSYRERKFESRVVEIFQHQPGYVLTSSEAGEEQFNLTGLRDPVSASPADVMTDNGLPVDRVSFQFKPFWSLEPDMVAARLRESLALGDEVNLQLEGQRLAVSGDLSAAQFAQLERIPGSHPLIDLVDTSAARLSSDAVVSLVRAELEMPASVTTTVEGDTVLIGGDANLEWYQRLATNPQTIAGWAMDFRPLRENLQSAVLEELSVLDGFTVYFSRRTTLTEDSAAAVPDYATALVRLEARGAALGWVLDIQLSGETDGSGTAEQNARLSAGRAEMVRSELLENGLSDSHIRIVSAAWLSGNEDLSRRRVVVTLGWRAAG